MPATRWKGLTSRYSKSVSKGILNSTPLAAASLARETQSDTSSLALSVTCTPCNGAAAEQLIYVGVGCPGVVGRHHEDDRTIVACFLMVCCLQCL